MSHGDAWCNKCNLVNMLTFCHFLFLPNHVSNFKLTFGKHFLRVTSRTHLFVKLAIPGKTFSSKHDVTCFNLTKDVRQSAPDFASRFNFKCNKQSSGHCQK